MDKNKQVLETMKKIGKPTNVTEVIKESGLDASDVEKAFKELKKQDLIHSPIRCKWEPKV